MDEEALFAAALEKLSGAERQAFLNVACGDDAPLRHRIERLLQADARTRGVLERGPQGTGGPTQVALGPGQLFAGRYQLLHKLGEGGMGEVWVADQAEPVRRRVALKVIRHGLPLPRLRARFEAEQQALALMDHPNIARVFDAGVAGERPYFVMELIPGVPVTTYCNEARLALRERLQLFIPVCHAVQHAHQKGVIHRDLKPANILVATYDGKPLPKVIDFGVARSVGPRLTRQNVPTEVGTLIGTLEYMAPEQVGRHDQDVDTRCDVYALGVVLYELLTDDLPIPSERLQAVPLLEMLQTIKEAEPVRPSARLAGSATLAQSAAARRAEPKALAAQVRGDLDWIALRCLEKDPARRYATASGLAEDIQRYLDDEPVRAGPPGVAYRLRKFGKRHRTLVLAAGAVLVSLVAGIVGTTLGLVEALHQGRRAEQARKEEVRRRLEAEWLLYAGRLNLAQQAWENNNAGLARQYLDACPPDYRGWEHDYLVTLFRSHQRTLGTPRTPDESRKSVSCVAVSPDGQRLVAGNYDATVTVWDAATGEAIHTLAGNLGAVTAVAVSPDGKRLAAGGFTEAAQIRVWEAATGREVLALKGHADQVSSLAFSPDGQRLLSASTDRTVKVWNAATGAAALTFQGHTGPVSCAAFSPDGRRLVSGAQDRTARLWDAATGEELLALTGHATGVNAVAFTPDGGRVVSGSSDQTLKVWDAATGREVRTLWGHAGSVLRLAVSADGKWIVSGSQDTTVRVWDAATGELTRTLRGHALAVGDVAVLPDGKRVVSGSWDNTVKVWDAAAGHQPRVLTGFRGSVSATALSADGTRLVSGSWDNLGRVWDAATGVEIRLLKGHKDRVTGVALSADGGRAVSGSYDRTVKVWDAATGRNLRTLPGHGREVTCVALSPDGRRIASGGWDKVVKLWDAATGQETRTLEGHAGGVAGVAFSPDGQRLVSGGSDQTVRVWDAATGKNLLTLPGHPGGVACVAFTPDGNRVVSGGSDQLVRVWDAATGTNTLTLKGHTGPVRSVALTPDGTRLVSGSNDHTVMVWDAATGSPTLTLRGHTGVVTGLAFSADGKRLVSASSDLTLRVWAADVRDRGR